MAKLNQLANKLNTLSTNSDYVSWFKDIKAKVYSLQIKAAVAVNVELLSFYWDLGSEITEKQNANNWGDAIVEQLSKDLQHAFPDVKGFSRRNLFYVKSWYLFYNEHLSKVQQLVAQNTLSANIDTPEKIQQLVGQIPWGHNILIITKIKNLSRQIESDLYARQGKATTNFVATLPKPQSDLANQTLKDPSWTGDETDINAKHTRLSPRACT